MSSHSERQSGHKLNDYCFLKTLKNQFINILSKKENKLHLSKSKVSYLMMSSFSKSQHNDRFVEGAYNFFLEIQATKSPSNKQLCTVHQKAMLL